MPMTLNDYIKKYGKDSGIKRYNGMQRTLQKRKEKYALQPYKRLTKEWFMWRYPTDGLKRFEEFANKSAHTEENFIRLYGNEAGKKKYHETIQKKDTVQIIRQKHGKDADNILSKRYKKQQQTMNSKTDIEKNDIRERRIKSSKPYFDSIRGRKRIDVLIEKYGEDEGIRRYQDIIKKTFSGPCRMSIGALQIYELFTNYLSEGQISEVYCDIPGKQEFWLIDNYKFYSYDFTHRKSKNILEYDGTFWHPRKLSFESHPVTKKKLIEMWDYDTKKIQHAIDAGFTVSIIKDTDCKSVKDRIIQEFCERIKNNA